MLAFEAMPCNSRSSGVQPSVLAWRAMTACASRSSLSVAVMICLSRSVYLVELGPQLACFEAKSVSSLDMNVKLVRNLGLNLVALLREPGCRFEHLDVLLFPYLWGPRGAGPILPHACQMYRQLSPTEAPHGLRSTKHRPWDSLDAPRCNPTTSCQKCTMARPFGAIGVGGRCVRHDDRGRFGLRFGLLAQAGREPDDARCVGRHHLAVAHEVTCRPASAPICPS